MSIEWPRHTMLSIDSLPSGVAASSTTWYAGRLGTTPGLLKHHWRVSSSQRKPTRGMHLGIAGEAGPPHPEPSSPPSHACASVLVLGWESLHVCGFAVAVSASAYQRILRV